ncbi:hypothetical protein C5167_007641 [Papaver somniferum]|nr:hypothetical protein C5167_007641 [Papaver somniferum]
MTYRKVWPFGRLWWDEIVSTVVRRAKPHNQPGRRYFISAEFNGVTYNLNDCCLIKAEEGDLDYIGRIVGFFENIKKKPYVTVKWFYRAIETVIKDHSDKIEANCVFSSDSRDDIPLDCIVEKVIVVQACKEVPESHLFYDMTYSKEFCTFENLCKENGQGADTSSSTTSSEASLESGLKVQTCDSRKPVMTLLDLYAGCGGMSTGLCMGAAASDVNLITVRCMKAEDFLQLLIKWKELCENLSLLDADYSKTAVPTENKEVEEIELEPQARPSYDGGVKWKGWGSNWDTWEPASNLGNCQESIDDFVTAGYKSRILPLPGSVNVKCGGPPCQGISGLNRKINYEDPLKDSKKFQLEVFMEIVNFLQPRFTIMENVVDILRFLDGTLGRLTIARLVAMHYQVRLGLLVACNFGLPQYRMRAFLWGAKTTEKLPQFPVPTHKVIGRAYAPKAFEITTDEIADEREYRDDPITDFQSKIRLPKHELMVSAPQSKESVRPKLYDHRPLKLSKDDYLRVPWIPKEKAFWKVWWDEIVSTVVGRADPHNQLRFLLEELLDLLLGGPLTKLPMMDRFLSFLPSSQDEQDLNS